MRSSACCSSAWCACALPGRRVRLCDRAHAMHAGVHGGVRRVASAARGRAKHRAPCQRHRRSASGRWRGDSGLTSAASLWKVHGAPCPPTCTAPSLSVCSQAQAANGGEAVGSAHLPGGPEDPEAAVEHALAVIFKEVRTCRGCCTVGVAGAAAVLAVLACCTVPVWAQGPPGGVNWTYWHAHDRHQTRACILQLLMGRLPARAAHHLKGATCPACSFLPTQPEGGGDGRADGGGGSALWVGPRGHGRRAAGGHGAVPQGSSDGAGRGCSSGE